MINENKKQWLNKAKELNPDKTDGELKKLYNEYMADKEKDMDDSPCTIEQLTLGIAALTERYENLEERYQILEDEYVALKRLFRESELRIMELEAKI